jgi:hypothetical protein
MDVVSLKFQCKVILELDARIFSSVASPSL